MYEQRHHQQDLNQFSFLITGGAGFIGSNIVEYLAKYNAGRVVILDNFATGFKKNIKPFIELDNVELIDGDIRDYQTCLEATKGIDFVSHQAALGSVPRSINNPMASNEVNVGGFLNMLHASMTNKVKKFVYAASSSTYGDHPVLPKKEENIGNPLSPYAVTKYVNELYSDVFHRCYSFESTGLRYFNVFGPRQDPKGAYAAVIPLFVDSIISGEAPILNGDGEQTRDFTFVENAVQANIKAFFASDQGKSSVMNIACGDRTTVNQLFEILKGHAGSDLMPKYGPDRPGDVRDSLANIQHAKAITGYDPQIDIHKGLEITWNWFKENQDFINKRD